MGIGQGSTRGVHGKIGSEFAGGRNMALADAGALHDPFAGGVHCTRQIVVAQNPARQVSAAAEYYRTQYRHEATPLATWAVAPACLSRSTDSPILASNS